MTNCQEPLLVRGEEDAGHVRLAGAGEDGAKGEVPDEDVLRLRSHQGLTVLGDRCRSYL